MNNLPAIRPVGYSREAVLWGYQGLHVVDAGTIGRLLYPEQKDPANMIDTIYKRNKKHFTEKDTVLIKVDSVYLWNPGGTLRYQIDTPMSHEPKASIRKKEMRFFTLPYGVIKICKFSKSPLAVAVLERMVDMHESFIKGTLPRWDRSIASVAQIPKWQRGRGELIRQIAKESGVSTMTVRRHAERLAKGEPLTKNCPGMKQGYCHRRYKGIKEEALRLSSEGMKAKDIAQRLSVPLSTVYEWIKNTI